MHLFNSFIVLRSIVCHRKKVILINCHLKIGRFSGGILCAFIPIIGKDDFSRGEARPVRSAAGTPGRQVGQPLRRSAPYSHTCEATSAVEYYVYAYLW
jgi:hypothetical protein